MSCELQREGTRSILPTKLTAAAPSLEGSKKLIRSFIYNRSSTNPANFVKIGPVDAEIIGLIEITKKYTGWAKNRLMTTILSNLNRFTKKFSLEDSLVYLQLNGY